jgi:hypothetical protein
VVVAAWLGSTAGVGAGLVAAEVERVGVADPLPEAAPLLGAADDDRPGSAGLLPVPGVPGTAAAGAPFGGVAVGVRSGVEVPWVVAVVSGMVRCHPG